MKRRFASRYGGREDVRGQRGVPRGGPRRSLRGRPGRGHGRVWPRLGATDVSRALLAARTGPGRLTTVGWTGAVTHGDRRWTTSWPGGTSVGAGLTAHT